MPRKVRMKDLFEVVRCLDNGLSYSKIVESVGVSKGYIAYVVAQLRNSGVTPAEAIKLELDSLQKIVHPQGNNRVQPDWGSAHHALQYPSMTMQLQYELYKEQQSSKIFYSYAHFCALYNKWCKDHVKPKMTANNEIVVAEAMEIDFGGDLLEWVDANGELHKCKVFVACLPYSEYTYAQLFPDETINSWGQGIIER